MEKVTIIITTYNLEKYIEQCLMSVLNQKTNFDYKILLADDASSDQTLQIVERICEEYPNKICIMKSNTNMGSLKNSNRAFALAKGQYITFLDGDDFWLTEDFLQEKIDFLDSHEDFSMCGSNTVYLKNGEMNKNVIKEIYLGGVYSFDDLLKGQTPFVHTSSLVLRNIIFINGLPGEYLEAENTFENCALRGEDYRFLLHLEKGKLKILPKTTSCYRIHEKGMWSGASKTKKLVETAISLNFEAKHWKDKKTLYFEKKFIKAYKELMLSLLTDKNIKEGYYLTKEETFLLTGLMNDIANREINWERKQENRFWIKLRKELFKLF